MVTNSPDDHEHGCALEQTNPRHPENQVQISGKLLIFILVQISSLKIDQLLRAFAIHLPHISYELNCVPTPLPLQIHMLDS